MDLEAIRLMAEREPSWQILLIGPVTKIDETTLPQAPNIHYTGQRPYEDLPGYLKAFDVCLIPFADNRATRYLSPTKTLEYFAGTRPVVSSPVADVVERRLFRPDLFYRLSGVDIRVPSLRERHEDIADLAHHFLERHRSTRRLTLSPAASWSIVCKATPRDTKKPLAMVSSSLVDRCAGGGRL